MFGLSCRRSAISAVSMAGAAVLLGLGLLALALPSPAEAYSRIEPAGALEGTRREAANDDAPEHGLRLRGALRW